MCKPPHEIDQFLKDKYILLLYNEKLFNTTGYNEDRITKRSKIEWIKLSPRYHRVVPFELINTKSDVQERAINLDGITEKINHTFTWRQKINYPYEFESSQIIAVTFEINPNLQVYLRQGYDILDFFSDTGGLYGACLILGYLIVTSINRDLLDNYIVSKLFKMEKEKK